MAGMSLGYLATGSPWLLVAIVVLHFETATQFLSVIRMDGYYVLSDLIGVPDLFSRLGPVVMSMIPGRATHPRVLELKPWVRRTITLWVVIAVPALLCWVIGFVIVVLPVVWERLMELGAATGAAAATGSVAETTLGVIQIILLMLLWVGSLLVLGMTMKGLRRWALARWGPERPRVRRS